ARFAAVGGPGGPEAPVWSERGRDQLVLPAGAVRNQSRLRPAVRGEVHRIELIQRSVRPMAKQQPQPAVFVESHLRERNETRHGWWQVAHGLAQRHAPGAIRVGAEVDVPLVKEPLAGGIEPPVRPAIVPRHPDGPLRIYRNRSVAFVILPGGDGHLRLPAPSG